MVGLHRNKLNGWACVRSGKDCWPTSNASRSETIESDQFVSSANNPECIKVHTKNALHERDADRVCRVCERCDGVARAEHGFDDPMCRDAEIRSTTTSQARQTLYSTRSDPALRAVLTYASAMRCGARTARSCHALRTLFKEKRDHLGRAIGCCARGPARNAAADRAVGPRRRDHLAARYLPVLQAQRRSPDVRFGDLAIEMGLMTRNELVRLLMIQTDRKRPLARACFDNVWRCSVVCFVQVGLCSNTSASGRLRSACIISSRINSLRASSVPSRSPGRQTAHRAICAVLAAHRRYRAAR